MCCSSWGHKELDMIYCLNNNLVSRLSHLNRLQFLRLKKRKRGLFECKLLRQLSCLSTLPQIADFSELIISPLSRSMTNWVIIWSILVYGPYANKIMYIQYSFLMVYLQMSVRSTGFPWWLRG